MITKKYDIELPIEVANWLKGLGDISKRRRKGETEHLICEAYKRHIKKHE